MDRHGWAGLGKARHGEVQGPVGNKAAPVKQDDGNERKIKK